MSIETMSRQRLRFLARSGASGRGFTGDCVILDEAYELPAESLSALVPTLSARPNPQVWITSSAPKQTIGSEELRKFCRRGREGKAVSVAYIEYSADPESDPDSPATWAEANPNLGVRITEEWISDVEIGLLGDQFGRERLGIWDDEADVERVILREDWDACEDKKSGPVGPVAFGLDVSHDRKWAAFAVAGESGRGGTHVEVTDYERGTGWLVERAKSLQDEWGGTLAVATGSPAASLLLELETAGVTVLEVGTGDHARACGGLYDAVIERKLRHFGQPALTVAVGAADRKYAGDAWLWARRLSTVDISPLVAVTLAKWAFETLDGPSVYEERGLVSL